MSSLARRSIRARDAVWHQCVAREDRTGRIPEPTPTLHRYTCIGQRLGHAPYSHCVRAPSADERSAYRHFELRSVLNQYQAEISTPCVQRSVHRSLRRPRLMQSRRFPHALTRTYHCTTTRNGAPQPVISFWKPLRTARTNAEKSLLAFSVWTSPGSSVSVGSQDWTT